MSASSNGETVDPDEKSNSNKRDSEKQRRDQENFYLEELSQLISSSITEFSGESGSDSTENGDPRIEKGSILKNTVEKLRSIRAQDVNQGRSESILPKQILGSLVLEALDGFMFIVEEGGKVEFASENISEFVGYTQDKLVDQSIFNVIHLEDHARFSVNLDPSTWQQWRRVPRGSSADTADKSAIFNVRFKIEGGIKTEPTGELNHKTELYENMQVSAIVMDGADEMKKGDKSALLCIARRIPPNETFTDTPIEAFTTQLDLDSWCISAVDTSGLPDQYVDVIGPHCIGKKLTDLVYPQDGPLLDLHLKLLRREGNDISRVYRIMLPSPHYNVYVKTKSRIFKDEAGVKGCVMSTHNIVRETELLDDELPGMRTDLLPTLASALSPLTPLHPVHRKEEILVNKIQPNEYCSDVPEGGINLDSFLRGDLEAFLPMLKTAAKAYSESSENGNSRGSNFPNLLPLLVNQVSASSSRASCPVPLTAVSINSVITSEYQQELGSGEAKSPTLMQSMQSLFKPMERSQLNLLEISPTHRNNHRHSTTILRPKSMMLELKSSSIDPMVGQPAVGQSPEPMVSRSVGGRNLDTMVTQSGRTVGPLGSQSVGGRRADPMVPVAGNPIISRQLSSPLNTAFRSTTPSLSIGQTSIGYSSISQSSIGQSSIGHLSAGPGTPGHTPGNNPMLRSSNSPRSPLSPNMYGRVAAPSPAAAGIPAAAVKNEILSSLLSNNSNIRHTGQPNRGSRSSKTNELLKELLTAKENLAGRAAQTENISLRQLLNGKTAEKQTDSELLRRLNQPVKDPSSRSKLSELSKLLEARSAHKRSSYSDEGPPSKMVPSLETLLRKDSSLSTPTSTGISPKWSEIPNKNLPRSEIIDRFRENRNNNAPVETRVPTTGGILAAKLMSPLNSPQQQQQPNKDSQQQQERSSPQDWPSELFETLLDWPELENVMNNADLLSTLDTVLSEDQAQISAIEQQLKQVEKSISSQPSSSLKQMLQTQNTNSSSSQFSRTLVDGAMPRLQYTAAGPMQHSPGSPLVSPSLVSPGGGQLVSPGGMRASPGQGGMRVSPGQGQMVGQGAGQMVGQGSGQMVGQGSGQMVSPGGMRPSPAPRGHGFGTSHQKILQPRTGGNMDDLMKGIPPNVTMKPGLESTGMDGPVRHLSGDSNYSARSPLSAAGFPRPQRHASGDGVLGGAGGFHARSRNNRHVSGDQIQGGSEGLNPVYRRLSGDSSSFRRQEQSPYQNMQQRTTLPIARKSSVSSTAVSHGVPGANTTTTIGTIGSTNLGTIGSTTIRSAGFNSGGRNFDGTGGRSFDGPSGRSLNQEDLESFGLSVEVTKDEFFLNGRDLTSPQGIKQVTVTSSGQMTPGGQMRNQFSPGGQPQGPSTYPGKQFPSGNQSPGNMLPTTGNPERFSPMSSGNIPRSFTQTNPIRPNSSTLIRPNNQALIRPNNQTLIRPNNQALIRPNNQTLIRPNNQALIRPNNQTLIRPNNPTLIRANTAPTSTDNPPLRTSVPGLVRVTNRPQLSSYQPARTSAPDSTVILGSTGQLNRSTSLRPMEVQAGSMGQGGGSMGQVQLRRAVSIPTMNAASHAQQFSTLNPGSSSLQLVQPNHTPVIQTNQGNQGGQLIQATQGHLIQTNQGQLFQTNQGQLIQVGQSQASRMVSANQGNLIQISQSQASRMISANQGQFSQANQIEISTSQGHMRSQVPSGCQQIILGEGAQMQQGILVDSSQGQHRLIMQPGGQSVVVSSSPLQGGGALSPSSLHGGGQLSPSAMLQGGGQQRVLSPSALLNIQTTSR